MTCLHTKCVEMFIYSGTDEGETDILKEKKYTETSTIPIGTKIKYIKFDSIKKVFWEEYGTIAGIYKSLNSPEEPIIKQYNIRLVCGGRISGAISNYLKIDNWNTKDIMYMKNMREIKIQSE